MTTGQIKTKDDCLEMQNTLENAAKYSEDLISKIPKKEDIDFKGDTEEFLTLIAKRLRNIKDRYMHLQAKNLMANSTLFSMIGHTSRMTENMKKQFLT